MTSTQIRQQFIDFFASKGHVFVPSSPVVPHDDPTIMFANAGMNQFKPIFLGIESPTDKRVANTQKCIRAGGKHNDLDDVGKDTYHHTFFEMLGNWSFGDYFKKEAIEWAWELLTGVWGIDKDRLHATYFEGLPRTATVRDSMDPNRAATVRERSDTAPDGHPPDTEWELEPDDESRNLWASVTDIDPSHIHPGGMKDNFWEMGETGPCGPCSEIHIDLTPDKSGAGLVNKGDPRMIELWNLVFIQFNRAGGGKLTPLPAKHVDTGLGFERLCSVLQGMEAGKLGRFSNYDTDVFVPIFDAIRKRTDAPKYRGMLPTDDQTRDGTEQTRDRKGTDDPEPQASACANSPDSKPSPTFVDSRGLKPAAQRSTQDVGSAVRTNTPDHAQVMVDISYRVIADHVRCLTFALTDGAIPSNEGRGYVLRRILRRAVRFGRQYMNMHEPFLCDLVQPVIEHMADAFPELRTSHGGKNKEHVAELIRDEEASFLKTLDRGLRLANAVFVACQDSKRYSGNPTFNRTYLRALVTKAYAEQTEVRTVTWNKFEQLSPPDEVFEETQQMGRLRRLVTDDILDAILEHPGIVPGKIAFTMHDTYGFPIDLTELMAEELGITVDIGEYERLMEEARNRARSSIKREAHGGAWAPGLKTKDSFKYETMELKAEAVMIGGATSVEELDGEERRPTIQSIEEIWLDRTCFYAEQGGQVGDRGTIEGEGWVFEVRDTQLGGHAVAHIGVQRSGIYSPQTDDVPVRVVAKVDPKHRIPTMQNHTSTHLLNWALREVLEIEGTGKVDQKGSLVDPEKTRFDYSHNKPLTDQELNRIESLVNEAIEADLTVFTKEVDQKEAREINTLRAVFGEKYPDKVRVVSIGAKIDDMLADPKNEKWMQYSVEFCGGTHLKTTAEAERFTIITEEGVAKGIRRVVGISGDAAKEAIATGVALLAEAKALADTPEPQASACANAQTVDNLATALTRFQQKVNDAVLSVQVRRELQTAIAEVQKRVKEQDKERAAASGEAVIDHVALLLKSAEPIDGVTVVVCEVPSAPADKLRSAVDWIRNKTEASAVLLVTVSDKKVTLLAGMSKVVVKRGLKAGDLIREIAPLVGGKGGGRPDMAQGGGSDPQGVPSLLDHARTWITAKLS